MSNWQRIRLTVPSLIVLTACAAPYSVTEGDPVMPPGGAIFGCVSVAVVENVTQKTADRFTYRHDNQDEWQTLTVDQHIGHAYGDCEDYALTVQQRILDIGFAPHTARMALLYGGSHAVLVVQSCEAGQVVADEHHRGAIVPVSYYAPEQWHMIQGKGQSWSRAAVVVSD